MFTVLWCYLRNNGVQEGRRRLLTSSADLTGQANHLGVTIEADIIKQKAPENNGGFTALNFGKTSPLVYDELTTDQPDRPLPVAGRELLHGAHRAHQLRWRVEGRGRHWPKPCAPRSSTSAPAAWA